jgi:hypothetical protein
VPVGGKPEALKNRIDSDYRRFGQLIRDSNIKGD